MPWVKHVIYHIWYATTDIPMSSILPTISQFRSSSFRIKVNWLIKSWWNWPEQQMVFRDHHHHHCNYWFVFYNQAFHRCLNIRRYWCLLLLFALIRHHHNHHNLWTRLFIIIFFFSCFKAGFSFISSVNVAQACVGNWINFISWICCGDNFWDNFKFKNCFSIFIVFLFKVKV
jgi:hypothetical protein